MEHSSDDTSGDMIGDRYRSPLDEADAPKVFVETSLRLLELDHRSLALRALAEWSEVDHVDPALFQALTGLARPSWGTWNALLIGLTKARRTAMRDGKPALRVRAEAATDLGLLLGFYEQDGSVELRRSLGPLAGLVGVKIGRRIRHGAALGLAIALRNRAAHDLPSEESWWTRAGEALKPLLAFASTEPLLEPISVERPPWFVARDGELRTFNGIQRDGRAILVNAQGTASFDPDAGAQVLGLLHKLLGKSAAQERDLGRLLARLAPDELKGVLLGDLLVGRQIGAGSFATVHIARELSTDRQVAVKILRDGLDEEVTERFMQEASFLARLDHAHIVSVIGYGHEGWSAPRNVNLSGEEWFQTVFADAAPRKHFIALEWLRGRTLEACYGERRASPDAESEEGSLDERTLARFMLQAARALQAVHAARLIHRDVTPSNLMLAEDPNGALSLKLMDFGIARSQDALRTLRTLSGDAWGTPAYMSPEQIRQLEAGAEIGTASDIYSLCATFYELFTGTRCHDHDRVSGLELRTRRLKGELPERPRARRSELSWEIETILLGGLEGEVADRYASADAMVADLRRLLADEPIHFRRPSLLRRVHLGYRRNRVVVNLLGAFAAVLAVGVAVYVLQIKRAQARTNEEWLRAETALVAEKGALRASKRSLAQAYRSEARGLAQDHRHDESLLRLTDGQLADPAEIPADELVSGLLRGGQLLWRADPGFAGLIGWGIFSHDGGRAAGNTERGFVVWDAETGRALRRVADDRPGAGEAWSPLLDSRTGCLDAHGDVLVLIERSPEVRMRRIEIASGLERSWSIPETLLAMACDPAARYAVGLGKRAIVVHDLADGSVLDRVPLDLVRARLAEVGGTRHSSREEDFGERSWQLRATSTELLAVHRSGTWVGWRVGESGVEPRELTAFFERRLLHAVSPNGVIAAALRRDGREVTLEIWRRADGELIGRHDLPARGHDVRHGIEAILVDDAGRAVVLADRAWIIDVGGWKPLETPGLGDWSRGTHLSTDQTTISWLASRPEDEASDVPAAIPMFELPAVSVRRARLDSAPVLAAPSAARCLAVSPLGRFLAVGTETGELAILRADDGEQVARWTIGDAPLLTMVYALAGDAIFIGDARGRGWCVAVPEGRVEWTIPITDVGVLDDIRPLADGAIAWLIGSRRSAYAGGAAAPPRSDVGVAVTERTGRERCRSSVPLATVRSLSPRRLRVDPTTGAITTGSGADGAIYRFDPKTGKERRVAQELAVAVDGGRLTALAFAPEGDALLIGQSDGRLVLIGDGPSDARRLGELGAPIRELAWLGPEIAVVATGRSAVFTANTDGESRSGEGCLTFIRIATGEVLHRVSVDRRGVRSLVVLPDGRLASLGEGGSIHVHRGDWGAWQTLPTVASDDLVLPAGRRDGQNLSWVSRPREMRPDGSVPTEIVLMDEEGRELSARHHLPEQQPGTQASFPVPVVSPDGRLIARIATPEPLELVLEVSRVGEPEPFARSALPIEQTVARSIAFSSDGSWIAVTGDGGACRRASNAGDEEGEGREAEWSWIDRRAGLNVIQLRGGGDRVVVVSDSNVAIFSGSGPVVEIDGFWDSAAAATDGRHLVLAERDGSISWHDFEDGRRTRRIETGVSGLGNLQVGPDGDLLIATVASGEIVVIRAADGALLARESIGRGDLPLQLFWTLVDPARDVFLLPSLKRAPRGYSLARLRRAADVLDLSPVEVRDYVASLVGGGDETSAGSALDGGRPLLYRAGEPRGAIEARARSMLRARILQQSTSFRSEIVRAGRALAKRGQLRLAEEGADGRAIGDSSILCDDPYGWPAMHFVPAKPGAQAMPDAVRKARVRALVERLESGGSLESGTPEGEIVSRIDALDPTHPIVLYVRALALAATDSSRARALLRETIVATDADPIAYSRISPTVRALRALSARLGAVELDIDGVVAHLDAMHGMVPLDLLSQVLPNLAQYSRHADVVRLADAQLERAREMGALDSTAHQSLLQARDFHETLARVQRGAPRLPVLVVTGVAPGSDAAALGLKTGDCFLRADDVEFEHPEQVEAWFGFGTARKECRLTVWRESGTVTLEGFLDTGLNTIRVAAPARVSVAVHGVQPGGSAARAGILPGDIITELDGASPAPLVVPALAADLAERPGPDGPRVSLRVLRVRRRPARILRDGQGGPVRDERGELRWDAEVLDLRCALPIGIAGSPIPYAPPRLGDAPRESSPESGGR